MPIILGSNEIYHIKGTKALKKIITNRISILLQLTCRQVARFQQIKPIGKRRYFSYYKGKKCYGVICGGDGTVTWIIG